MGPSFSFPLSSEKVDSNSEDFSGSVDSMIAVVIVDVGVAQALLISNVGVSGEDT